MPVDECRQEDYSRTNTDYAFVKDVRVMYIISAVLISPVIGWIADLFRIGNYYMILLVSLRVFYIQYIPFAILTLLYIWTLKTEKPDKSESGWFKILLILHIIGFANLEFLFKASMGI